MKKYYIAEKANQVYIVTSRPPLNAIVGNRNGYSTYEQANAVASERKEQVLNHRDKQTIRFLNRYDFAYETGNFNTLNLLTK